jgi:hypothetical protein
MDMSGKFNVASDTGEGTPAIAFAWREGEAIPVDLARQDAGHRPEPRRVWPEHIAIAALFIATWALAANQLGF